MDDARGRSSPRTSARPCCTARTTRWWCSTATGSAGSASTAPALRAPSSTSSASTCETESDSARDRYEEYMRQIPCPACNGARLNPASLSVLINGKSIAEVAGPAACATAPTSSSTLVLTGREAQIASQVLKEIQARLTFLLDVGLEYLNLERRLRDPLRRGGPAHPAGHADRFRPGGRAVCPGRALHRTAPAGQPPADRNPHPAPGPRQHADCGGARRGHHPRGRLGGGHRTRRRRARRRGGALRLLPGAAGEHASR